MKDEPRHPAGLLEFPHEDGVAAVCRDADDGSLWLTAQMGSDEWCDVEGNEIAEEETDRVVVLGGRAPTGASVAELRDATDSVRQGTIANHVWPLVVARGVPVEPLVLFRDASGAIVPLTQPPGSRAEPILDADTPCPACRGREWDLVTRPERDRWQPERMIVCRRCGHEALAYSGPPPPKPEIPPELGDWFEKAGEVLGGVVKFAVGRWEDYSLKIDFPVYGLGPDWTGPRALGGFATAGSGRAYSVELGHGDARVRDAPFVLVGTREEDERRTVDELVAGTLREGLEELQEDAGTPRPQGELSDPAQQLYERLAELGGELELDRRVAASERRSISLEVDGRAVEVVVAEADGLAAGAASVGLLDITVLTQGVAIGELDLRQVEISAYRPDRA